MCRRLKVKEVNLGWEREKGAERRQDKRRKDQSESRKNKAFWEKGVKQEREHNSLSTHFTNTLKINLNMPLMTYLACWERKSNLLEWLEVIS